MDTGVVNLTRTWFDEHLQEAYERVRRTGHREWFAKSLVIPAFPLIPAFAAFQGLGWYCAWPDGRCEVGLGTVREWQWNRTDGILFLQSKAQQLRSEGLPHTTPIIAGLAFSEDSPWPDWPSVYAAIPQVHILSRGEEMTVTVHVAIDAHHAWEYYLSQLEPIWLTLRSPQPIGAAYPVPIQVTSGPSRDRWRLEVERATTHIRSGDFDKVVLARALTLTFKEPVNVSTTLENLKTQNPDATVFGFRRGQGVFLGATPELLAKVQGNRLDSMSLAGSAPRGITPEEDLSYAAVMKSDPKTQREHAVVREHVRNALAPLTESLTLPDTPLLKRLPTVQHLMTPIHAILKPTARIWSVAHQLHPTPAVAGYPVETAQRYIVEQAEPFTRGWYAGSFGFSQLNGDGQWMVALRSGIVEGNSVRIFAGCGIMAESDPDAELNESDWKFGTMLSALELEGELY